LDKIPPGILPSLLRCGATSGENLRIFAIFVVLMHDVYRKPADFRHLRCG